MRRLQQTFNRECTVRVKQRFGNQLILVAFLLNNTIDRVPNFTNRVETISAVFKSSRHPCDSKWQLVLRFR